MKKVSVFVDVQNIYYTTKEKYNRNFDYNKFWSEITSNREVVTAIAYAIDSNNEKQKQFQNILRAIGFEVKLKPFINRSDGSAKGDWDVGIAIDIMEYVPKSDIVVLASGDGDFDLLIKKINNSFNVTSEVCGIPGLTSNSLIIAASKFFPTEESLLL